MDVQTCPRAIWWRPGGVRSQEYNQQTTWMRMLDTLDIRDKSYRSDLRLSMVCNTFTINTNIVPKLTY